MIKEVTGWKGKYNVVFNSTPVVVMHQGNAMTIPTIPTIPPTSTTSITMRPPRPPNFLANRVESKMWIRDSTRRSIYTPEGIRAVFEI